MTFIAVIAAFVGFVLALKVPLWVLLAVFIVCCMIISQMDELEGFILGIWPMIWACVGALFGLAYYYFNYYDNVATGLSITNFIRWFFHP